VGVLSVAALLLMAGGTSVALLPLWPRGVGFRNWATNWGDGVTEDQVRRPRSVMLTDVVDPALLTSSWLVPAWALAAYRALFVVFWVLTMVFPAASGSTSDPNRSYLRFFTHWTILLLCVLGGLGAYLGLERVRAAGRGGYENRTAELEAGVAPAAGRGPSGRTERVQELDDVGAASEGPRKMAAVPSGAGSRRGDVDYTGAWGWGHRVFYALYAIVPACSLLLTLFYWGLLHQPDHESYQWWGNVAKNVMVHGANVPLVFVDILVSEVPLATYHWAPIAAYLAVYVVYMWLDYAVGRTWAYDALGWEEGVNVFFLLGSVVLAATGLCGALLTGYAREALRARLGR